MAYSLKGILEASRARDWRLSLVPFIMGCVYLWIKHFHLSFNGPTLTMLALSLMTATGFASLGYFINEYFDRAYDARAGKANRLTHVPHILRMVFLMLILLFTFIPWVWLPHNTFTWVLIGAEISFFLLYSLPFPRLKTIPILSNLLDTGYAYLLPLLLSFHTYALYIGDVHPLWMFPLLMAVAFIGFRNIVIHQVNDLFSDRRAGLVTLPSLIGPTGTSYLIAILLSAEVLCFLVFGAMLAADSLWMLVVMVIFVILLVARLIQMRELLNLRFLPLEPVRHLPDPYYQVVFPAILLLMLVLHDWRWALLIPIHMLVLVPKYMIVDAWKFILSLVPMIVAAWWRVRSIVLHLISISINYPIYLTFRLFGVDLIKEQKSAIDFLRSRFS